MRHFILFSWLLCLFGQWGPSGKEYFEPHQPNSGVEFQLNQLRSAHPPSPCGHHCGLVCLMPEGRRLFLDSRSWVRSRLRPAAALVTTTAVTGGASSSATACFAPSHRRTTQQEKRRARRSMGNRRWPCGPLPGLSGRRAAACARRGALPRGRLLREQGVHGRPLENIAGCGGPAVAAFGEEDRKRLRRRWWW